MNVNINGVIVRPLEIHEDSRGWLTEVFRQDELPPELFPRMSYVSMTRPGVVRGPHEHREQTDIFAFVGSSTFLLKLWDNRPDSQSFGTTCEFEAGREKPLLVIVPPGVVHAYKNVGEENGLVYNAPNRLFAGPGRKEKVDEIRHENKPGSPFKID
ncbi:MAG: dTDP-4-dehydrorhamnose 3,5-epimerase family protein [Candidatus Zixiibacteriota bacterium]